jgi:hypothetical protein
LIGSKVKETLISSLFCKEVLKLNDHDAKRMKDRCDRLLSMIRKEFADDRIEPFDPGKTTLYPIDRWMVSIERCKGGNRVVFKVDRPIIKKV